MFWFKNGRPICVVLNESIVKYQRSNQVHTEIRKKLREKTSAKKLALDYFDFFYASSYGDEWKRARLAMLTGNKSIALLNKYINSSDQLELTAKFEQLTALNMISFINKNEPNKSKLLDSKGLKIFTFDNGIVSDFPSPRPIADPPKVINYYCMDGASILPIFALNIQKNDVVLDLCASPGGKTIGIIQTLEPKLIVCRDISKSRLERLERNLRTHLPRDIYEKLIQIEFNNLNNMRIMFDRVLVDAPCTNDRNSLKSDDNNIFSRSRSDERASISKKQVELLTQGVLSCKLNGTIVYSTCSLSPIQNEGVVNTVLKTFENESEFKLTVESLEPIKSYFAYFFDFSQTTKLGLTVMPSVQKNFGPFYLCKINKLPK